MSRQTLADGSVCRYGYTVNPDGWVAQTSATTPDGVETVLAFDHGRLIDKKTKRGL